jgi:hypothetical protein
VVLLLKDRDRVGADRDRHLGSTPRNRCASVARRLSRSS